MPTTRNPSAKSMRNPDTVNVLVDGDQVNANNLMVEVSPGGTPNLTLGYLHDLMKGFINPGSQTHVENSLAVDVTTGAVTIEEAAIAAGDTVYHYLDLPTGSTLTAISSYILPGAHGALPATMPTLAVEKVAIASGLSSSVHAPVTDSSASTGTYDIAHAITVSGMSEVIDRTLYRYRAAYTNEASTNSTNNLKFIGTKFTITV